MEVGSELETLYRGSLNSMEICPDIFVALWFENHYIEKSHNKIEYFGTKQTVDLTIVRPHYLNPHYLRTPCTMHIVYIICT